MEMAQREAAKLLGVPEHSFSRFLTGKRKISFEFAQKLYRTFNIDPKTILSY
jgi:plasmid maintenance system antidote protein VapI